MSVSLGGGVVDVRKRRLGGGNNTVLCPDGVSANPVFVYRTQELLHLCIQPPRRMCIAEHIRFGHMRVDKYHGERKEQRKVGVEGERG